LATILAFLGSAAAALQKPTYASGDRWVYGLAGSVRSFPGLNSSQAGSRFDVNGQVEVKVIGTADLIQGNTSFRTIRVDSHTSGFLNGTFRLPNATGSVDVTGTFMTDASEFWEDQGYLTVAARSTTSYVAQVTYIIFPTTLVLDLRVNASTKFSRVPTFDLDIGQSATADQTTHLDVNSTVTFFGRTRSQHNATDVSSRWRREVLSRENVTVPAGTFASYRLNQTAGSFPGIPGGVSRGNETAYFSNDVGYYSKRVAYENGTPVAEMRLKSYSYGAPPSGLRFTDFLFPLIAVVGGVLLAIVLWRRRKARIRDDASRRASPEGPQAKGGGNDRAR
jgi:hypothetical protein